MTRLQGADTGFCEHRSKEPTLNDKPGLERLPGEVPSQLRLEGEQNVPSGGRLKADPGPAGNMKMAGSSGPAGPLQRRRGG